MNVVRISTCVAFGILLGVTSADARQGVPPQSRTRSSLAPAAIQAITTPAISRTKLLNEDAQKTEPGPLRFAAPYKVDCTPWTDGTWEVLSDGSQIWRCQVDCPNATDINLGFSRFLLPEGATLHISSLTYDYYQGPYTSEDNKPHGEFWTPMVPGDLAELELYLPPNVTQQPELVLTQINQGYRDMFKTQPSAAKQGTCNNDVICPVGDPWRDQIRSVAGYSFGGSLFCTGNLIMDVPNSFRNFFLTADHCGIDPADAPSLVVYWNFESANCGDLSGGALNDNQSGSTFRADDPDVDMTLVELDDTPDPSYNVFYSGWDRSGSIPSGSVGIHHPNGDEKAISFNTDALLIVNCCIGGCNGINSHWEVDDWEDGTTEPGSSGSGLWDSGNKLLIGFLSGGSAACPDNNGEDCYGRFSEAWDGATSSDRLKDWLDPSNTGAMTVQGSNPGAAIRVEKTVYLGHDSGASCPGAKSLAATNGAAITYCFEISNSGNTNLTNVQLLDAALGVSNNLGTLAVGGITTQIIETTLTSALVNTGRVVGTTSAGPTVTNESTAQVFLAAPKPLLLFPAGGEVLTTGSTVNILWDTNGAPPTATAMLEFTDLCSGEPTTLFFDNMESGVNGWTVSHGSGTFDWFQVANNGQSPVSSWFATNATVVTDQYLVSPAIVLPGSGVAELSFWQEMSTEAGFDGGVIEISTSGTGGPWADLGPHITLNPYNGTIDTGFSNPLGGQDGYTGDNGGFTETRVDLAGFTGETIRIRFRLGTDSSLAELGWWIDDVRVSLVQSWTTIGTASAGATSFPWTVPSTLGTNYCVRAKFSAPGYADSEYCQGGAFEITDSGPGDDDDNDGLPNGWEIENGLDPNDDGSINPDNGPLGDPDGDQVLNIHEYVADTEPTNGMSYLRVSAIDKNSPVTIDWLTSTQRNYTLSSTDSVEDENSWSNLLTGIPGTGSLFQHIDDNVSTARFYRIEAELPPAP